MEITVNISPIKFSVEKDGKVYEFEPIGEITNLGKLKDEIKDIVKRFRINTKTDNIVIYNRPEDNKLHTAIKRSHLPEIWDNIKEHLNGEFTAEDYWNALQKSGYNYKESTRQVIPYQQMNKLIAINKIEKVSGTVPIKWKKVLKTEEE